MPQSQVSIVNCTVWKEPLPMAAYKWRGEMVHVEVWHYYNAPQFDDLGPYMDCCCS
jgi:hypothetical protein